MIAIPSCAVMRAADLLWVEIERAVPQARRHDALLALRRLLSHHFGGLQ